MTLRHLEIFLAVAETGSMRKAAEQLYISQPTVSGAIREMEEEYDVTAEPAAFHHSRRQAADHLRQRTPFPVSRNGIHPPSQQ